MINQEIAKIFYELSSYLEMEGVAFKPYAYQRAAESLETLEEDIQNIYQRGGLPALEELPSVGKGIAQKIEEYFKTGKIKEYEKLKKKIPINLKELISVEGLGPKKVKALYQKLKIRNLKELEKAAKAHKISPLFGFGEKTEKNILEGIKFLKRGRGRFLLGEILPVVKEVFEKLKNLKEVEEISLAGSVRRMKETIGDADFLVAVKPAFAPPFAKATEGEKASAFGRRSRLRPTKSADAVADFFVSLPGVIKVWGKGATKASVRMKEGFDMDIRVVPQKSYGSALQYFTGSKEHNIETRKIAIDRGLKLNEYGVFRGSEMIAGKTEEEVYRAIGLSWIPPELRENEGEIEAALKGKLPKIIDYKDIKGDLHSHSNWDGGANSIEEMAEAAEELGYEYIGIADHTKFLRIEHGLDERQLAEQRKEIKKLNFSRIWRDPVVAGQFSPHHISTSSMGTGQAIFNFQILQGCECNILNDGSVDIKDEALEKLDFVIAGVHSSFKMARSAMTERIIKAMKNPHIDIISHPTGRLIQKRDEYQIDFDKILRAARETGTILEINAHPERLDLKDIYIKKAKEAGVKMLINTDSHHKDQLRFMEFGVAQARRGWAEKNDIINTQSLEKLLKFF